MNANYLKIIAGFILYCIGIKVAVAQSGPEFQGCASSPVSLCVNDAGVRLPANNQIYLGEADPNAISSSVHLTQSMRVKVHCGKKFQYGVQLILDDTSGSNTLQPLTTITADSLGEAELLFNTETSPVSFIRDHGIPYNEGCYPYHRIKWIVIDSCGEFASCDELINLYDCQAPLIDSNSSNFYTLYLPPGCNLYYYAKDFTFPILDDSTPQDSFLFSLSEEIYKPDSLFDPCIGPFGVEVPTDIWAADGGRDMDCNGVIDWSERNKYVQKVILVFGDNSGNGCCDPGDLLITGDILTEDVQAVELVTVTPYVPGYTYPSFITGKNGIYQFLNITTPTDITITAERNDNYKNGVSTLDIVRIQKHLLGIEALSSIYDSIAADANNSNTISAIDLIELRKLVLGIYTALPNNKSWRFVPKSFDFDSLNPLTIPDAIITTIPGNASDLDFVAIKIGDVNNTVMANAQALATRESNPPVVLNVDPKNYEANEFITIDFSINDLKSLSGFQFTLFDPNLEFLSASSNHLEITEEDFALFGDQMTMSWFDLENVTLEPDEIIFSVKAMAKKSGSLQYSLQLNSDITEAEMYSGNDQVFTPKLVLAAENNDQLHVSPVEPNPWSSQCVIPFSLKENGEVILTIYNTNGEKEFTEREYYSPGYHEITIHKSDLQQEGLKFYTLQSGNEQASGKMIFIK